MHSIDAARATACLAEFQRGMWTTRAGQNAIAALSLFAEGSFEHGGGIRLDHLDVSGALHRYNANQIQQQFLKALPTTIVQGDR